MEEHIQGGEFSSAEYNKRMQVSYQRRDVNAPPPLGGGWVGVTPGIYWFQSRWYDGTLGRFTQPDSIVPIGRQGTQAWDRYAFVNNNPVRYNDPTGHMIDEDKGGMKEHISDEDREEDPCIIYGQDSAECRATTSPIDLPDTITLHPLDGNIVAEVPIYDSSTPPKIIGYTIYSYHKWDEDSIDINIFAAKSPLGLPLTIAGAVKWFWDGATKALAPLGLTLAGAPEFTAAIYIGRVINYGSMINSAITFDAHLQSRTIYLKPQSFFDANLPFIPFSCNSSLNLCSNP